MFWLRHIGDSHQRTAMWLPESHLWFTLAQERTGSIQLSSRPALTLTLHQYIISASQETSFCTLIILLLFFLVLAAVPLWPSHSQTFGWSPECNCTSNKQLFSEFYSHPPSQSYAFCVRLRFKTPRQNYCNPSFLHTVQTVSSAWCIFNRFSKCRQPGC